MAWSAHKGSALEPNDYAVSLKKVEIETDKDNNTKIKETIKQPAVK
jgi:membrane protein